MTYQATVAGRLPLCHLETALPFTLYPDADHTKLLESIMTPPGTKPHGEDCGGRIPGQYARLNPHMVSMSAAVHGPLRAQAPSAAEARDTDNENGSHYSRMSNVMRVRGPSKENLPHDMYACCTSSQFFLTSCIQRQTALYLPRSYPHFFRGVTEFGFSDSLNGSASANANANASAGGSGIGQVNKESHGCLSVTQMSALGADSDMGIHIGNVSDLWAHAVKGHMHGTALQAQLDKGGFDNEECDVISQKLHELSRCYEQ